MSFLSQFFSSNKVGLTAGSSTGVGVGASTASPVVKLFTSSGTTPIPCDTCYVSYGVIGAGGCGRMINPGFPKANVLNVVGAGGGFSYKEQPFSQPTPINACVTIGCASTIRCFDIPLADAYCVPSPSPTGDPTAFVNPEFIPSAMDLCIPQAITTCPNCTPRLSCIAVQQAGNTSICGTGLTTITATGGQTFAACFGPIFGIPCFCKNECSHSIGGFGVGGDVNTSGGASKHPKRNFPGTGAGNLLGDGREDSAGWGFGGAGNNYENGLLGESGLIVGNNLTEPASTPTNPFGGQYQNINFLHTCSGASGAIAQHTYDRCNFSILKTLFTSSGGAGFAPTPFNPKNWDGPGCFSDITGICGGVGGVNMLADGSADTHISQGNDPNNIDTYNIGVGNVGNVAAAACAGRCFGGGFGGGGSTSFCSNPQSSIESTPAGQDGFAGIEYWEE